MSEPETPSDTAARARAVEETMTEWSVLFLVVIGLWLILAPLVPEYTGYAWLDDVLGGAGGVARFFTGFLFLYFAGIVKERNQLRGLLRRLAAAARAGGGAGKVQSGDLEQKRAAVDLLIQGLDAARPDTRRTALENLRRLTGADLGEDRAAWERWWAEHRSGFGE